MICVASARFRRRGVLPVSEQTVGASGFEYVLFSIRARRKSAACVSVESHTCLNALPRASGATPCEETFANVATIQPTAVLPYFHTFESTFAKFDGAAPKRAKAREQFFMLEKTFRAAKWRLHMRLTGALVQSKMQSALIICHYVLLAGLFSQALSL